MIDALWSDDELRSFFFTLRNGVFGGPTDEYLEEGFIRQARLRIAPEVQRRLLADIGAVTDAGGIARVALGVLEDEAYGQRRAWLLVTSEPWAMLTELVTRDIRKSHRASTRRRADARTLDGIADASTRTAIEAGEAEAEAAD